MPCSPNIPADNDFAELDLPEYESYETLRAQVLKAITAGSDYFGFA
jgi:E3 ubiquitin-protein ligase HUWE1